VTGVVPGPQLHSCDDCHCVTCSDEGVPMRVLEVHEGGLASCDDGVEVLTDLVGIVEPGDRLLVHAGVALVKLP
jgi:hydrogenase maturation factor